MMNNQASQNSNSWIAMFHTKKDHQTLKKSMNFGISLEDSNEFIFLPSFSEILFKSSFVPGSQWTTKQIADDKLCKIIEDY